MPTPTNSPRRASSRRACYGTVAGLQWDSCLGDVLPGTELIVVDGPRLSHGHADSWTEPGRGWGTAVGWAFPRLPGPASRSSEGGPAIAGTTSRQWRLLVPNDYKGPDDDKRGHADRMYAHSLARKLGVLAHVCLYVVTCHMHVCTFRCVPWFV